MALGCHQAVHCCRWSGLQARYGSSRVGSKPLPGQETLFTLPQYQRIMYIAQQKLLPLHLRDESQKASESAAQPAEVAVEPSPPSALDGKTPYIGYLNDYLRKLRLAAACLIERR